MVFFNKIWNNDHSNIKATHRHPEHSHMIHPTSQFELTQNGWPHAAVDLWAHTAHETANSLLVEAS
jgi:hypothetical protein